MQDKIKKVKSDIQKVIDKLDSNDLVGPIPFLEEALENLDAALEEWELYNQNDEDL